MCERERGRERGREKETGIEREGAGEREEERDQGIIGLQRGALRQLIDPRHAHLSRGGPIRPEAGRSILISENEF